MSFSDQLSDGEMKMFLYTICGGSCIWIDNTRLFLQLQPQPVYEWQVDELARL